MSSKTITRKIALCISVLILTARATSSAFCAETYLSPIALVADKDGKNLYVAEYTGKQIAVFDVSGAKVTKTIDLKEEASGVALSADGKLLAATGAAPEGKVYLIDPASGAIKDTMAAGHTPTAPVFSPDSKTLYVCDRFNDAVAIYDLSSKKEVARIKVKREPNAAALTPDGKFLFVANLLPAGSLEGDYAAAAISIIDTAARKEIAAIALPNGSSSIRGICLSPDGQFAYATHVLSRYQLPTTQLERGWMNTNALSVVDVANKKLVNTVLLDNVDLGAANPWGVACTADGRFVCVAQAGTHEINVIDRAALHEKLAKAAKGEKVSEATANADDVPNDLSFLVNIRRRLKLAGNGARGLVLIGTKAYAAEYFTDSLGVVDIMADVRPDAKSLPLGPQVLMTPERKGEMFFSDASLCFQNWQSCSSCHPDARVDGLNWDLLNDGIGNPKNTRSMLYTHKMPPVMSLGIRETAEKAVRSGIKFIQFAVRPEEDAAAIDAYLKSLTPVPSPYLVGGKLSEAAKRGEKIFQTANCAKCHPAPLYTDLKTYDLGLGKDLDKGKPFKSSTLIEVWRTAPYLYDGRAATLKDVFKKFNPTDKHGLTSKLSDKELDDLIEYVNSL